MSNMMRLVLLLALPVAACTTGRLGRMPAERATVEVDNRSYLDMTIYVVEGGSMRRRLGTASAARTSTFTIPESTVGMGREVQFMADPIAGTRTSITQRIFVRPGETVILMIPPQ